MAEISAQLVKQLRDMTGAGMMDCKKALVEADGDIESAIELLRKSGMAKAAKKVDRESKEGRIETAISDDARVGAMILLASETDFVARNDDFIHLAKELAKLTLKNAPENVEQLMQMKLDSKSVEKAITELVAKIGENIKPRKLTRFELEDNGLIYQYVHPGNKVGVMVELKSSLAMGDARKKLEKLSKELAMQIAFSKPVAISRDEIPEDIIQKEKKLYTEQAKEEGKPEKIIDRIVEGKLKKFVTENCLLYQEYIRDNDITVKQLIQNFEEELSGEIQITRFARFEVGLSE
ncbi:elongation factor Ts [bacterium]|nr:MAG: elongation factor Ts [bacterium]